MFPDHPKTEVAEMGEDPMPGCNIRNFNHITSPLMPCDLVPCAVVTVSSTGVDMSQLPR